MPETHFVVGWRRTGLMEYPKVPVSSFRHGRRQRLFLRSGLSFMNCFVLLAHFFTICGCIDRTQRIPAGRIVSGEVQF